jgi:hypothetical protein
VLGDRAERQRREERESADDQDHADQEADEERRRGREGAGEAGTVLLGGERFPASAIIGTIIEEAADEHRRPEVVLYQKRVAGETGEGRAVVAGAGGE